MKEISYCRGTRKTADTCNFVIQVARIRETEKGNVEFVEHNLSIIGKILEHCSKAYCNK